MGSSKRRTNDVLRDVLRRVGWSPEQLSAHLNSFAASRQVKVTVSAKAPYHWLGGVRPHDPVPGLVAALLTQVSGDRVTVTGLGWDRDHGGPAVALADDGLADMWAQGGTLSALQQVTRSDTMPSRRTFLTISGAALTAAAHLWMLDGDRLAFAASGRRVDAAIVDDLDRIVAAKRRVDDALGGGVLYRSVAEELAFVVNLLNNSSYTEAIGERLYGVAAELARLAGWACFDSGDNALAQRHFLVAVRAAHQSGDKALGAHILGFIGVQSTLAGNPGDAVTVLKSSYEGASSAMTATEKAALFGRLARAHGAQHDRYATDSCADRAFALLAESKPAENPDRIYWCDAADLSGMIGEGYVALGDADKATMYLQRAVDGLSPSRPRDRVIWMTSLASAHLRGGRREQALSHARHAASIAADLNSDRVVGYIGAFRASLGVGPHDAPARDFDEYLRATFPARLHPVLQVA